MYLITTELEPSDIMLFNDSYNIIGINKKYSHDKAFKKLTSDLKNKEKPSLFLATRNFEKIYQVCFITKASKSKDLIFNNQVENINDDVNAFLYTKSYITTHAIDNPQVWSSTKQWNPTYMQSFTEINTLYHIAQESEFFQYLKEYLKALTCPTQNLIIYSNLFRIKNTENTLSSDNIYRVKTIHKTHLCTNIAFGFNNDKITPGSWVFLETTEEVYGILHVVNVRHVQRKNRQRFINNFIVMPVHYNWTIEVEVDIATYPRHFNTPTKWGSSILNTTSNEYLKEYVNAFSKKIIPENDIIQSYEYLLEDDDQPYNHFQWMLPFVFQYERIYILNTTSKIKLYNKVNFNNEDVIYLDLTPSLYLKVNVDKWDKKVTKQFLEDIKKGNAHIFLANKKYDKIFMSTNVLYVEKYKSQQEKSHVLLSPFTMIIDHKYNADVYTSNGILPLMLKSKQMWNINGQNLGQKVKSYQEISHVFKQLPEKSLQVFSKNDISDKLHMFEYLKNYLIYETAARANNSFIKFTSEDVSSFSDIIEPKDYSLRMEMWHI